MRKLIAGLLILCASALFAGELIDPKFLALWQWQAELTERAVAYNEACGKSPEEKECTQIHAVLNEQFKFFIKCADGYRTLGTDCRAKLRPRLIANSIREFEWDLRCGGVPPTDWCVKESAAYDHDNDQLQKESDQCIKETEPKL